MRKNSYFNILHNPDPTQAGNLCHVPEAYDPCAWFIEIYPDATGAPDPVLAFAVHWYGGHGRVVCHWEQTGEEIYTIGQVIPNEDGDFEFIDNDWSHFRSVMDKENRQSLSDWLCDVEEQLKDVVAEQSEHWPTADAWNKMFPRGGTLHPPIG